MTTAQDAFASARVLMFGLTAVALVLGALLARAISRSITRPLNAAVKVAQTVAAGDLSSRIDVSSQDETGQLMQALKDMNASWPSVIWWRLSR